MVKVARMITVSLIKGCVVLEVSTDVTTHLGPFPGDSADAVALVEQRLICCWEQGILKQTPGLLALPPQCGERLALVWNHHPPEDHTSELFMLSLVFFLFTFFHHVLAAFIRTWRDGLIRQS